LLTLQCLVEGGIVVFIMYGGLTNEEIFEWANVFKSWWHLHILGDQI
jgi:hypothetical protein